MKSHDTRTEAPPAAALLLAAGESRRMGRPKALLRLKDGRSFFGEAVEAVYTAGLTPRIAVVNPAIAGQLEDAAKLDALIGNHEPQLGQLHSLQLGLRWLTAEAPTATGAMVLLVDNPGELAQRVGMVLRRVSEVPGQVLAAGCEGEPGHPLWLPRRLWRPVLEWTGPEGLRGFLKASGEPVEVVETGLPSAVRDIDFPEEYERLIGV
jgi:molybdenum cofactor cytidylyltransferase